MAPVPQEPTIEPVGAAGPGDAPPAPDTVVITGMSGLLPGCHNIEEFAEKLYNKENLVKQYEPRWQFEHPELGDRFGLVPGLDRFDAQFFMVHYRLGNALDAMARKIMENTYQAIFDAGMSPSELSSQRVGVYIGVGATETEKGSVYSEVGLGILGCSRAMIANRVSYWLNSKGPSIVMDASCCSSLAVFEKAYTDIATGVCDAAVVGACKVYLHPQSVINHSRTVPQNKDGKMKCYDVNADGQSCSEAINIFLLQKYKDSKRVYASLCYAKAQFGVLDDKDFMDKFGFERDPKSLARFLRAFYTEAGIPPSMVEYVEGFGAAIPNTDKMELKALEEVFCKDRSEPLLLGSVMSNIGYTEAASGSSALIKILLAYQRGELAASLHCDSPRQDIAALCDGRMRIVTENKRFRRSYAAINGMSLTGMNGHALLGGHYKPKDLSRYQSDIPYLVTMSGRIESAVQKLIDHFKSRKVDPEEIALMHNIHKYRINGHLARGFGIFSTNEANETVTLREKAEYYDDAMRPLWFVYSGMGSQWVGMGTQLMRIPVFAAAIERCRKVLEPKGVDIIRILTSSEKDIYDNILHSFVGIAAVQIGLTDVLTSIGLVPDKIIGHSVGELGCAYADGCLTAEEMILAAYSRGLVSIETPFIVGSMAAVGIGYEKISSMLPPEIEVACHNGPESSTISGPANVMREFVAQLVAKGIFAKEVPCSNIAYHSRYIAKAGPCLLQYLSDAITPKLRSERWVSTSVPQSRWNEDAAKYSSAEYHTNNLLNPVLFEETARLIPSNAVVVEIAPHGLLQAILKRSLPTSCKHIPLTRRGHTDNTLFLLEAIGKLYMNGYDVNIAALYPQIEFPVSTETSSMSHLVEWVYTDHWRLCLLIPADHKFSTVYKPIITTYDEEYAYLAGHIIEGTRVFPFAAALVFVWDTLAMSLSKPRRSVPVKLSDIKLHVQPRLTDSEALHLTVAIQRGSGRFEVAYDHGMIAEGYIAAVADTFINLELIEKDLVLTANDVYKFLHEKGYEYTGEFRSVLKTDCSFKEAEVFWNNNWVTLIDGLFQLNTLKRSHPGISQPTHIKTLTISPDTLCNQKSCANPNCIDVKIFDLQNVTRCNNIIMENITFEDKPYIMREYADLKALQFYPFYLQEDVDILSTLYVFMQIVKENSHDKTINIFDIINCKKTSLIESIHDLLTSPPEVKHELLRVHKHDIISLKSANPKPDVLLLHDLLSEKQVFEVLFHCLPPNTFIVSIGVETEDLYPAAVYRPVCARGTKQKKMELAVWRPTPSTSRTALTVRNSSEIDFLQASCSHLPPQNKLFILAPNPPPLGMKEIIKQQKSLHNRNISVAIINHKDTLVVDEELDNLTNFDLTYNILYHGQWGGEYYVPLPKTETSEQTVALKSTQFGKLDSLHWVEVPEVNNGVLVTVHYAAINAYDAKRARAEIFVGNENDGYGLDFSGMTDRGQRVFGLVQDGAIRNRVSAQPELLWPVPDHWDLEDAATVPLPYLQAFYCLMVKTEMHEGMRVLIHSGAGALGQAAISIALAMRCEVFTTVSDISKKKFLRQLFPELKASHIGNSRDNTFADMILNITNGRGCDIIINSLKGKLKSDSLSCCAPFGTTLDVVQIHTRDDYTYGMYNMTKARSYIPVDFAEIIKNTNRDELQMLHLLVTKGISLGYVRPLSRVTYSPQEVSRAFRLLAASNHRGRVLIRMTDTEIPVTSLAQKRLAFSPDQQQVLISEEDELSLQLADRLIERGAKKLRLYLPRPSGYVNIKKTAWQKRGVQVDTVFSEIWRNEDLVEFLKDSKKTGNVESLFFIVKDTPHSDKLTTKKSIVKSVDSLSRKHLPTIRYFTVISEHHHFVKDVCEDRSFYGLPSLSLQLHNIDRFDEIKQSHHGIASDNKVKLRVAVDIIERALCSNQPVIFGHAQTGPKRTLLEEIALLPGISITSATDQRSTLEQVGLDHGRVQELCYLLVEKFNIVLPKESLPRMTINELKALQERFNDSKKDKTGLEAYFNAIDADEMIASAELLLMPTLLHNQGMQPDVIDTTKTYLCIVPGVEVNHDRFDILCERLKIPAAVLQPSFDALYANISEMAQDLVDVMLKRLNNTKTFYLLGYELGILVALEMAAILESYGFLGTVYCLGGTPDDVQSAMEMDLKGMSDHELQDALTQHLTTVMTGTRMAELSCLQEANSWHDKVEVCIKSCLGQVPYTSQFMRGYLNAAYNRIELMRNQRSKPHVLRSKIVILRAELFSAFNVQSMAGFSKQSISVHAIPASLPQIPKNLQCSTIIHKYLDPAELDAFNNRNQCDSYTLDDDIVMKFVSKDC